MKINRYSWLAALPMLFTACQNDTLVEKQQQNDDIYSLNCMIVQEATDSRAQIVLGNTEVEQEFFKWNVGDSFTLYQNDNKKLKPVTFTISSDYSDEVGASSANFYADESIPVGTYQAVYPTTVTVNADDEYERVALEQQKKLDFGSGTVEEVWRNYFSKNMLMRATVVLTENGAEPVRFHHECALARITYKNESGKDQPIGGVSLGGNQQFGHIKTLNVIGGWDSGASTNDYPIFIENLTVKEGETFDFYVLFFPCGFAEGEMHLNMNTSGNWKSPLTLPLSKIAAANNGVTSFIGGKRYWFNVTETADGLKWTNDSSSDVVTIKNIGFARALDWYYNSIGEGDHITLDENGYAIIDKELVESTTYLWTGDSGRQNTFTTLDGIEHFVNLQIIKSAYGALEECDFSKNKYLKEVYLQNNNLKSLDFSGNTGLEVLYCVNNRNLTSVNLSRNNYLKNVSVSTTGLTSLTIPNPAKVEFLRCSNLNLNTLGIDFNQFTVLKHLELSNSKYDVASLPTALKNQLISLTCSANGYTSLDLSEFTSLTSLICSANNLTSLAFPDIALQTLYCDQNKLSTLDLSKLTTLETLMCGNQQTGTLVLKLNDAQKEKWNSTWRANSKNVVLEGEEIETVTIENTELSTALQACLGAENVTINADGYAVMTKEFAASVTDLEISRKTQLLSLDGIEQLTNLQNLTCQSQQNITTLDFSGNVSLKFIDIQGCSGLQSLDLQSNVALEHLAFTYSKVTNLDLTKNVNLRYLAAYGNSNLVSMDISNCNKLTSLLVENTGLSSLTVNHPELLAELSYEGTALSLDLSQYTHLHTLFCSGKGSDFAKVTDELKARLNRLDCRNCGLTELDLTKYRNLGVLICSENHLTNLDLSAYSDFEYLCCGNQTDKNGKSIVLKLILNENLYDEWSQWVKEDSGNTNVELQTVDQGNGNTGGSDFTIEGIY